jgi:hypothetical protein
MRVKALGNVLGILVGGLETKEVLTSPDGFLDRIITA